MSPSYCRDQHDVEPWHSTPLLNGVAICDTVGVRTGKQMQNCAGYVPLVFIMKYEEGTNHEGTTRKVMMSKERRHDR